MAVFIAAEAGFVALHHGIAREDADGRDSGAFVDAVAGFLGHAFVGVHDIERAELRIDGDDVEGIFGIDEVSFADLFDRATEVDDVTSEVGLVPVLVGKETEWTDGALAQDGEMGLVLAFSRVRLSAQRTWTMAMPPLPSSADSTRH